ncbi:hypothetical protein H6P81_009388 [Aristolochia fimbriata]|uniref:Uncharacterized protein n=1 Tax=Aristolochia fimbriata TaxID=158543 RepID=A0AAV7EKT4_ARIFI|nr:hypothetical protein H6P81_009388 [Aristolochia fimbriata]
MDGSGKTNHAKHVLLEVARKRSINTARELDGNAVNRLGLIENYVILKKEDTKCFLLRQFNKCNRIR